MEFKMEVILYMGRPLVFSLSYSLNLPSHLHPSFHVTYTLCSWLTLMNGFASHITEEMEGFREKHHFFSSPNLKLPACESSRSGLSAGPRPEMCQRMCHRGQCVPVPDKGPFQPFSTLKGGSSCTWVLFVVKLTSRESHDLVFLINKNL